LTDKDAGADEPTESGKELGRRLAAARAYSRAGKPQEGRDAFATRVLGKKRDALSRYERGDIPEPTRPWVIDRFVSETKLPAAFFSVSVDLQKLPAMAEVWRQAEPEIKRQAEAAVQAAEAARDASLPRNGQSDE